MSYIESGLFYVMSFLSVYVQVFFFVTFLENRKKIVVREGNIKLGNYPTVTIAIPCWNEEKTVEATVQSVFNLNYPKEKIKLIMIDDGSTDGTWNVIKKYGNTPNVKIFHKENGGKHTALNLALEHTDTDFFGGLDADSIVDPESLSRIMGAFEKDSSIMAVAPSIVVHNPVKFIQNTQKTEYSMGVYFKQLLGFLGAIPVTPGPLTIFRKKVFEDLGPYRHGHSTEDMEIAYRMQKNHYKIEFCNDAFVYTNSPSTIRKLYKQRLRWIYGFINNTIDYRNVVFDKKYGNFSFFTLPMGIISILAVLFLFIRVLIAFGYLVYSLFFSFLTTGWHFSWKIPNFDFFFLDAKPLFFLVIITYSLVIFAMMFGRKMTREKNLLSVHMLYFFPVFGIIAPLWFFEAILNTIIRRRPAWR